MTMPDAYRPVRVQRQRTKGWRMPEGAVYVGRGSRWGNPFIISGRHVIGLSYQDVRDNWGRVSAPADAVLYMSASHPIDPAEVVTRFSRLMYVRERDEPDRLRQWLTPLRGRNLACWCPLDDGHGNRVPCHADVLLELANPGWTP